MTKQTNPAQCIVARLLAEIEAAGYVMTQGEQAEIVIALEFESKYVFIRASEEEEYYEVASWFKVERDFCGCAHRVTSLEDAVSYVRENF